MDLWLARAAGLGTSWQRSPSRGPHHAAEAAAIATNERVLQDLRIRLHYLAGRPRGPAGVRPPDRDRAPAEARGKAGMAPRTC
jgi:[protein-PII] uridylyltransferase